MKSYTINENRRLMFSEILLDRQTQILILLCKDAIFLHRLIMRYNNTNGYAPRDLSQNSLSLPTTYEKLHTVKENCIGLAVIEFLRYRSKNILLYIMLL